MDNDIKRKLAVSDTRRRFLKFAAIGGTGMLAGCTGNGDGDGGDGDGGIDRIDRTFRIIPTGFNPTNMQFNWLNAKNWADPVHAWLFDRMLWYMPLKDEYRGAVFTDWSFDGTTLTAEIDEDQTWHDGDDVTAEDVAGHWTLVIGQETFAQGRHPYFSSVEAAGDKTVEFTMHKAFNPDLVLQSQFAADDSRLYLKPSRFDGKVEEVRTALGGEDEDALQSIYSELQQMTFDEPIGSNYLTQDRVRSQFYHTKTFEDYPRADNINWTDTRFIARAEQQAMLNEITAGNVDATPAFSLQPEGIMNQWPEDRILIEQPSFGGRTVTFNTERIPRPLRRAIAWVVQPQGILDGTPRNLNTVTKPSAGVHTEAVESWLGDVASDFDSYEHSTDRATTILENAGYSRQDGSWVDPDGEPLSLGFVSPPWSDTAVPVAQVTGDNLNEFGIDTEVNVKDGATWNNDITNGNYDMTLTAWGGSPHPFFTIEDAFEGFHGSISAMPSEFEIPPVGEWEGSTETVNASDILSNLRTIQSDDEMRSGIQQLAWALNYHMPVYYTVEGFTSPHLHFPDRFDFTTDDSDVLRNANPIIDLPRYGQLQAVK